MDMIKVSANSRTSAVAGAIAGVIREHKHAEVQAIGAGAVNQAIKALALASGYLKNDGIEVACVPEFVERCARRSNWWLTCARPSAVPRLRLCARRRAETVTLQSGCLCASLFSFLR